MVRARRVNGARAHRAAAQGWRGGGRTCISTAEDGTAKFHRQNRQCDGGRRCAAGCRPRASRHARHNCARRAGRCSTVVDGRHAAARRHRRRRLAVLVRRPPPLRRPVPAPGGRRPRAPRAHAPKRPRRRARVGQHHHRRGDVGRRRRRPLLRPARAGGARALPRAHGLHLERQVPGGELVLRVPRRAQRRRQRLHRVEPHQLLLRGRPRRAARRDGPAGELLHLADLPRQPGGAREACGRLRAREEPEERRVARRPAPPLARRAVLGRLEVWHRLAPHPRPQRRRAAPLAGARSARAAAATSAATTSTSHHPHHTTIHTPHSPLRSAPSSSTSTRSTTSRRRWRWRSSASR